MKIIEINTQNRAQTHEFLRLPFRIYRDIPQWVPPIAGDARQMLDRRRYPFYQHSDAAFFIACPDHTTQAVGRIAVLEPRLYNDFNHQKTAFFYLFECENNPEAATALFEAAFRWARSRGLDHILGPKGFTALDGAGLLVLGFEHLPALGIPYNPAYYLPLFSDAGLHTEFETVSGYLDHTMIFPDDIHRAAALVQRRRGLKVQSFTSRKQLRPLVARLKELYNNALEGTSYNAPVTDAEVAVMANQILWFADPRLIKFITKDDEPVGFLLAYPDISRAIQRCKGRLFPSGWADLMLELKKTPWVNINGAGMVEKYRGFGGPAILFSEMYKSFVHTQYRYADLVQIGTQNDKMQRELKDLGINFYKMHRVYQRSL